MILGLVLGVSSAGSVAHAQEGCDNGVPVGGTACKSQGDSVEYVCQSGSKPGASLWQSRSCNGGTCQGSACQSAGSGCDNGVPVGGTACKNQGDSVEYVCQPNSRPGASLWQSRSCNGGTCQGSACQGTAGGGTKQLRVGANYTDLGRAPGGGLPQDLGVLRAQAVADLERLRKVGVTDLRIWAEVDGTNGNITFMRDRVGIIAEEAKGRGMRLTVTLIDVHRNSASDPETPDWPNINARLKERYEGIVKPNRGYTNIIWSVGNEISGPGNPVRLAKWYAGQVAELRKYLGSSQKVVAELVPGSVEHFEGPKGAEALRAANTIIQASDFVAVHYYPTVGAGNADQDLEFRSLSRWKSLAGNKFVLGEFGIREAPLPERYRKLNKWLKKFDSMGIRSVRLWQFLKDEEGHLDPWSFDLVIHQDVSPQLINGGWLSPRP
jgi:hypothetical protein